jgi:sulfate transport system ATP-binding protein
MGIEVKNISKKFGDFVALKDVNLEVRSGELIALLGPSGSGKTTLLRIIAGLEFADSGSVILNGESAHNKHAKERHVGFVFQHYALFKHMTVFENVAFGLRVRPKKTRPTDTEIKKKVMELLRLVHLDAFYDRYPSQLSGGQRQRVALARALAVEPSVLLLDEPFGALDAKVRKELRAWMRKLHDDIHITSVFVTHDQEEAMEVSDRVVVMSNGKVEQVGTPEEVWHHPANSFVYDFLGNYNEFEGWKDVDGSIHLAESEVVETPDLPDFDTHSILEKAANFVSKIVPGLTPEKPEPKKAAKRKKMQGKGKPVKIFARPHEIWVTKVIEDDNEYITARLTHLNPAGSLVKMELERKNGKLLQAEVPKSVLDTLQIKKGDSLFVRPKQFKMFE